MPEGLLGITEGAGRLLRMLTGHGSGGSGEQQVVSLADDNGVLALIQSLGGLHTNLGSTASLIPKTGPTAIGAAAGSTVPKTDMGSAGNGTVVLRGGSYTTGMLIFEATEVPNPGANDWFAIDVTKADGSWVGPVYRLPPTPPAIPIGFNFIASGYEEVRVRVLAAITGGSATGPTVTITAGPFLPEFSPTVAPIDGNKASFCASISGMSTINTGDIMRLSGSATKLVRVTRVEVTCITGAATNSRILIHKRTTANSGGTAGTAPVILANDTGDTATATAAAWTTGPTQGNSAGIAGVKGFFTTAAGIAFAEFPNFGRIAKAPILRGIAEGLSIVNSSSIGTSGSWSIIIEWTEEDY